MMLPAPTISALSRPGQRGVTTGGGREPARATGIDSYRMLPSFLSMTRLLLGLCILVADTVVFASERIEIPRAEQPQLCASNDGTIWLTYGQKGAVFVAESTDAGATFSPGREIGNLSDLSFGMRRGPRIAAHGDSVTVTVPGDELMAYASHDRGKSWTGPVVVNDTPSSAREGLHDLTVAPDGRLFVTWLDQRNGAMQLWAAESADGGTIWAKNQLVYRSPDKSVCECCHPSALFDGEGNLAVMWRNSISGARDLWMAVRRKGETDFSTAKKLGSGTWPLNACPMDGGRIIALGGGRFASVWQRAGEVFYAPLDGPELRIGKGRQPVATTRSGITTVYFQDGTDLVSVEVGSNNPLPAKHAANARFASAVQFLDNGAAVLAYEQDAAAAAPTKHGPGMHGAANHAAAKTGTVVIERL